MYKPKLAFLIPRLGITDRGAEIFVYELAKRLQSAFSVVAYTRWSSRTSPLILELKKVGVYMIHVPSPGAPDYLTHALEKYACVWKLLLKLHITPIDVEMLLFSIICFPFLLIKKSELVFAVHGVWGAIFCRFLRLVKGTPFVYSSQGGIEPLIALQKPDVYFVFNKSTLNWYRKYFPQLKLVHVPIGIDIKRFTPVGRKVRMDLPRPIIMVAAALIPAKKVDRTIQAVAQLKKGSLVIVGNGPLKEDLQELAERIMPGRYLFTSCANFEMPLFYRTADLFTFAAKGEEFGLVYLEALACGLPVVGNDEDHVSGLIGNAGVVCDTDDIDAYSRALRTALKKKRSYLPRRQALKFTWEKVSERYKKELSDVVAKR